MGIVEDIQRLERGLEELRLEYEHYFSGRARLEPSNLREAFQKNLLRWRGKPINNTMYKFRYQNLVSRFNAVSAYWNRCLQEIEDGTFKRDTFRQQIRERERREKDARRSRLDDLIARHEGRDSGEDLYKEFVAARAACGLGAGNVRSADFEAFLQRQREDIRSRFDCAEVEFKVSVEDCKVRLIAKPRRGR
ncbi:MAG: MXAN_5187 C-terminal domain-containing protein [Myxococcota bacterium]